jgi:hypothetical protein
MLSAPRSGGRTHYAIGAGEYRRLQAGEIYAQVGETTLLWEKA